MKPNVFKKVFDGIGAAELPLASQYKNSAITIIGLASGTMTIRAKLADNPVFENVLNGTIILSKSRTITILNTQLDAIELTVSPEVAFTVRVKQTGGDTER